MSNGPGSRSLVNSGCLVGLLLVSLAAAGKPPVKPPPTPTPVPTPAPTGCTTCEIVYTRAKDYTNGPQDLMLMKKDGSSKTVLLAGATGVFHKIPEWAPDGQWIAFSTVTSTGSRIRVIKADGSASSDVATFCSGSSVLGWRTPPAFGGYWLVYSDSRDQEGCIVTPPPGETTALARNLWAVHVSLGVSPVLVGPPVCLTCDLNPQNDYSWGSPAWSRDGLHLSTLRIQLGQPDRPKAFMILDIGFDFGLPDTPSVVSSWPFAPPELTFLGTYWPTSWARWSDSLVLRTNASDGTTGLIRYEVDFGTQAIASSSYVVSGSSYRFAMPQWSADDTQLVDDMDGIQVITLSPFSLKLIASNKPYLVDYPDWKPITP